jgi:hypothetical protein
MSINNSFILMLFLGSTGELPNYDVAASPFFFVLGSFTIVVVPQAFP